MNFSTETQDYAAEQAHDLCWAISCNEEPFKTLDKEDLHTRGPP